MMFMVALDGRMDASRASPPRRLPPSRISGALKGQPLYPIPPAILSLSHSIQLCALARDLAEDYFVPLTDKHLSLFRALRYPKLTKAPEPGRVRAGG